MRLTQEQLDDVESSLIAGGGDVEAWKSERRELVAIAETLNKGMASLAYDLREHMQEYEHVTTPKTISMMAKLEELLAGYFAARPSDDGKEQPK